MNKQDILDTFEMYKFLEDRGREIFDYYKTKRGWGQGHGDCSFTDITYEPETLPEIIFVGYESGCSCGGYDPSRLRIPVGLFCIDTWKETVDGIIQREDEEKTKKGHEEELQRQKDVEEYERTEYGRLHKKLGDMYAQEQGVNIEECTDVDSKSVVTQVNGPTPMTKNMNNGESITLEPSPDGGGFKVTGCSSGLKLPDGPKKPHVTHHLK